ncbi:SH2 domain-containing protein 4A isoform X2 [Melospiza melodia melodia]|uniref:SH2 domain-containing protein 4A isoform X2 n=1 Tax=Melospiza melodia melodia TaxID=1914991 RepID=UPI002FD467D2
MLKQILSDMYIDPELLAELSEEQKQILFFKMRQEQIRRWEEREAAAEKISAKKPLPRKANRKSVTWKLGADNEVWVWVMGEHPSDKSYAAICEEIQAQRAKRLAREQGQEGREEPEMFTRCWRIAMQGSRVSNRLRKHRRKIQKRPQPPRSQYHRATPAQRAREHCRKRMRMSLNGRNSKSKAADEKRRSLARQARDDYRRLSLQGIHRGKQADISKGATAGDRRPLQYPPLPPKPKLLPPATANGRAIRKEGVQRTISNSTEESIIKWFKEEQFPLRAGYLKTTDTIAPWFHGILTSKKAEELLNKTLPGSFLIRVSEKIKGYVLSYRSVEGCKHFLIDASSDSYSFLGVDQLQHSTLADLVDYHKDEPITSLGKELLLYPCGQEDQEPDYIALFE